MKSGYVIPVAAITKNNEYVRLLECHSKSSLEDFLSQAAIKALQKDFDAKFVWRSGSTSDNSTAGKIGKINISGYNINSTTDNPNDTISINMRHVKFPNIHFSSGTTNSPISDVIGEKSGAILKINKNGNVYAGVTAISQGGTGATNKVNAKKNLGIYSGEKLPSTTSGYEPGDIFLKII